MAAKKKVARVIRADSKESVAGLLGCPATVLDEDEKALADQFCIRITELLQARTVKVLSSLYMMQAVTNKKGTTEWRRLSMIGDELMGCTGAYFGKRDGMILTFNPITVPLGLKTSDLNGSRLECPFKHFGSLLSDTATGKNLKDYLADLIDFKANPKTSIEMLKEAVRESERQRLIREANVKVETYGSNWGAF